MDQRIGKVYCGASQVICSLGVSKQDVVDAIDNYSTSIAHFEDGTPYCAIDKTLLNLSSLCDYTFAEQLAISTLQDVAQQSGILVNSARTALIISSTKGNIDKISSDFERSYLWTMGNKIASYFDYKQQVIIVSNACVSGVTAIAVGARMIESGEIDNAFIVGVDISGEFVISGFNSFKSVSPTICRPYDEDRDGLTIGEGCGALLITNNRDLSESKIVVTGYGLSDDANHISGPSRTGDGLFFAIDKAMKMAGVSKDDIGLVNAHGTATPFNDEMESKALNWATLNSVPCNSLKPYIGHTLGASGIIEVVISLEEMMKNRVFGVKGYKKCGVPFELNVAAEHRDININHCLKCASGFGGTNAAILLSKESECKLSRQKIGDVNVEECASILLDDSDKDVASGVKLKELYKELGDANLKFYKMNNLAKAGYVASCKMLADINLPFEKERIAVVLANRSSSLDADILHQENVDKHLPEGTSPAIFVYTLANIVAAEIAIKHKFQGESTTFILENKDMEYIKEYSYQLIKNGECDAVLYGWCELLKNDYNVELKMIIKK